MTARDIRLALALALTLALAACSSEPQPLAPPALPAVPTLAPSVRPWRVHPAGDARCDGASIDPPDAELAHATERAAAGDVDSAYAAYLGLAVTWPHSSTVRVRAAALAEESRPSRDADAARLYGDALALDDRRCGLPARELWVALRGVASLHARNGEWAAAVPYLERAKAAFPAATPTRYELAAARCHEGDVARCADETAAVLAPHEEPDFVLALDGRSPAEWRALVERDPDLAPLRRDPRWAALAAAH